MADILRLRSPGARGTEGSASVLPALTTSRISSKTQSHAVHHHGELHGYYEGDNWKQYQNHSEYSNIFFVLQISGPFLFLINWLRFSLKSNNESAELLSVCCSLSSLSPRNCLVWCRCDASHCLKIVHSWLSLRSFFAFSSATEMSPALFLVRTDLFYGQSAFPAREIYERTKWDDLPIFVDIILGGGNLKI